VFVSVKLLKVKKYPKTRKIFKIFETDSSTLGLEKLQKVMGKVMETHEI